MVVVAIIAILASIAYPAYTDYIVKTRRSAGAACLLEQAQFMERYYTTNMGYRSAALPATACRSELSAHYAFDFSAGTDAATYTLAATPLGGQASPDRRGHPRNTQAGTKTTKNN